MNKVRFFSIAALLASSACDNDPGKGKTEAVVAAPVAASAAPSATGAASYAFGSQDSKIEFVGAKVTRKHDGSFGGFNGSISLVDGDPQKGSVKVDIDTATIAVDEPKLAGHLKTPDFFDVEKFPKASFVSTSVKGTAAAGAYSVTGNLDLHGVSKSLTFPATIHVAPGAVDVNAEFVINRKDFGIVYPGKPDDLIKDDVLIKLTIHAKKA